MRRRFRELFLMHPWLTTAGVLGLVAVAAAVVVISGVVSIRASSGHWPITAWFLDFAKVRSVTTGARGIQAPPLDGEALILRGATAYETACYSCHGKPGAVIPPVMAAMTPPPPDLTGDELRRWTSEQLFAIVKHGIKFTGMPAWPAQERDDEVWAIVAFLRRMPDLQPSQYQALAFGEASRPAPTDAAGTVAVPDAPAVVRNVCSRCHGIEGTGRGPGAFPSIAGQRAAYTEESLQAYAEGQRFSGIMRSIAASLTREEMREVAAYYESVPARLPPSPRDAAAVARGATIAGSGDAARDIPACVECHGPAATPKVAAYPILAGQHAGFLRLQLELLQRRQRGGSERVNLMHAFVDRLQPAQLHDLSLFFEAAGARPTEAATGASQ